jgi:hypothetical protein
MFKCAALARTERQNKSKNAFFHMKRIKIIRVKSLIAWVEK